jgi:hypothetical protein
MTTEAYHVACNGKYICVSDSGFYFWGDDTKRLLTFESHIQALRFAATNDLVLAANETSDISIARF